MPLHEVKSIIGNQPTFDVPLDEILAECRVGGALDVLNRAEYITEQQRRWFKGVLLPALAKHTGDSKESWETRLKLAVLPDDFQPYYLPIGKQVMAVVPSITKLSKKKMGELIEGSVAHLRDESIYGDEFLWVTLPDSDKKREAE